MIKTGEKIIEQAEEDFEKESRWFTYDSQEELPCNFVTKPSDPHPTFAVYDEQNRHWEIRFFKEEGEVNFFNFLGCEHPCTVCPPSFF